MKQGDPTMTSIPPNASTSGSKSLNTAPSFTSAQHGQATSLGFGASSSRRASGQASNYASQRNNQGLRKQHKSSRKPRLADEDAMAESVRLTAKFLVRQQLIDSIGCHEECQ